MTLFFKSLPSPVGEIRIYADELALVGLYIGQPFKIGRYPSFPQVEEKQTALLRLAEEELKAYFAGRLRTFTVPVRTAGTDFQKAVWKNLQTIGFGELRTYGDVAGAIDRPTAVRATGGAIGRNPVSIIIPCHRVIGKDDSLTGFGGGLPVKKRLLELEGHAVRNSIVDKARS